MMVWELLQWLHPLVFVGVGVSLCLLIGLSLFRSGRIHHPWKLYSVWAVSLGIYGYLLLRFIAEDLPFDTIRDHFKGIPLGDLDTLIQRLEQGLLDPLYGDVWFTTLVILVLSVSTFASLSHPIPLARVRDQTNIANAEWLSMDRARKLFKHGDLIIGEAIQRSIRNVPRFSTAPLLKFQGDTHLLTCSGTGGGKTTSVTIPNFLYYPHGLVALDPKGDITTTMIQARKQSMEKDVAIINPMSKIGGMNVLALCDISSPNVLSHIRSLSKWICGEREIVHGDPYFTEAASSLIECLIAYELFLNPQAPSLRHVRENLSLPLEQLQKLLKSIYNLPKTFGFGLPQKMAGPLYDIPKKQFAGVSGIADTSAKFLMDETVLHSVTETKVDLRRLVAGEMDIVIQLSLELMGIYPGLSRLLLGSILYYVYGHRPHNKILFLVDEMPRLGYMRLLEEARDMGRGLGIILWCIVQELGQLRKIYGYDGIASWLENTGVQQFFGIKALETAKRLIETLGETTIDVSSISLNQSDRSKETRSVSNQVQRRALITINELLQLGPENQLILSGHNPPLKCAKSPYYRRKEFLRMLKNAQSSLEIE